MMKLIPGFAFYKVSHLGEVYRNGECKPIRPYIDGRGYKVVRLNCHGVTQRFKVHRLVAMTWFENYSAKYDVHHKDGNKLNNRLSNLQLVTKAEHRALHGCARNEEQIAYEQFQIDNELKRKQFRGSLNGRPIVMPPQGKFYSLARLAENLNIGFKSRGLS